jgi:hypothetical protein
MNTHAINVGWTDPEDYDLVVLGKIGNAHRMNPPAEGRVAQLQFDMASERPSAAFGGSPSLEGVNILDASCFQLR